MAYEAQPLRDEPNCPDWMVWDGHLNVTGKVAEKLGYEWRYGAFMTDRQSAERLAREANERIG